MKHILLIIQPVHAAICQHIREGVTNRYTDFWWLLDRIWADDQTLRISPEIVASTQLLFEQDDYERGLLAVLQECPIAAALGLITTAEASLVQQEPSAIHGFYK